MSIISGISGAVNGISTCAEWSITPGKQLVESSASNTAGAKNQTVGNEDWKGRMRCYGKEPPVYPGASLSFVGQTGAGSYAGSALVASCRGNFPISSGGPISWDIDFEGISAITRGVTAVTDATSPAIFTAAACKVQRAGTDVPGVQSFTLELTCKLPTYVNAQVIKRVAGGLGCSFSVDQVEADPAAQIAAGDIAIYKLFVDASTFYQISYGVLGEPDQNVPIESGEIVAYRLPFKFSLYSTTTRGGVLKPGGAAFIS